MGVSTEAQHIKWTFKEITRGPLVAFASYNPTGPQYFPDPPRMDVIDEIMTSIGLVPTQDYKKATIFNLRRGIVFRDREPFMFAKMILE